MFQKFKGSGSTFYIHEEYNFKKLMEIIHSQEMILEGEDELYINK